MYLMSAPQLRIAEFVLMPPTGLPRPVAVDPYAVPVPAALKRHGSAVFARAHSRRCYAGTRHWPRLSGWP
ncbi:MAG: hypothetical protein U1F23_13095 [Lysobacterales bacterium]